jgi:MarR family transcriptional regulator, teicoplanin-associated locus regulator
VTILNKKDVFRKLISFTTSVHRVTHELTLDAKSKEVTQVQYHILECIAVNPPLTSTEISECQLLSLPNTSRELKKLSDKNLIEKYRDPKDRRKQYIRLSKEGEIMMGLAFEKIEARFLNRIQNASVEDLEEIIHAIDVLHKKVFY